MIYLRLEMFIFEIVRNSIDCDPFFFINFLFICYNNDLNFKIFQLLLLKKSLFVFIVYFIDRIVLICF